MFLLFSETAGGGVPFLHGCDFGGYIPTNAPGKKKTFFEVRGLWSAFCKEKIYMICWTITICRYFLLPLSTYLLRISNWESKKKML